MAHIFIVEDESDIAELLALQLKSKGHQVTVFNDGQKALEAIQTAEVGNNVDLFMLDRMLPGVSGLEICKFLRMYRPTKTRPILMLTALARPEQVVEGLEAGADDYITKPFENIILMARIQALLRRSEGRQEQQQKTATENSKLIVHGQLKVDLEQCQVWLHDSPLELTLSEYKILCIFLESPGKVYTRNQLVQLIQGGAVHVTDRTIDTHIFGLRKKLGEESNLIETIRGIGYRVAFVNSLMAKE